jgi:hypothetical protein
MDHSQLGKRRARTPPFVSGTLFRVVLIGLHDAKPVEYHRQTKSVMQREGETFVCLHNMQQDEPDNMPFTI